MSNTEVVESPIISDDCYSISTTTFSLIKTDNTRMVFFQEPDEPICTGPMIELTGGDSIFARRLNDNTG